VKLTGQAVESNAGRNSRVLASRLQGLLGSVQQYCNIVDTCAGPNQIAALVWGGIKVFILVRSILTCFISFAPTDEPVEKAFSNFADYFEKLSEKISQLGNYCPRFNEYEKLFPQSSRLQHALSDFYAIVVRFCSKAFGAIQEKGQLFQTAPS
jgi:hypothetical protein